MEKAIKKAEATDGEKKEIFLIAPIGEENTEVRGRTEIIIKALERAVSNEEYSINISHKMNDLGSITDQIVQLLLESKIVIADLTDHNANVFYELAVRHWTGLPVITIAKEGTALPFDVKVDRTIFYKDGFGSATKLAEDLQRSIKNNEHKTYIENPITRVTKKTSFQSIGQNTPNVAGDWEYTCICDEKVKFDDDSVMHGGTVSIEVIRMDFGYALNLKGQRTWKQKTRDSEREILVDTVSWKSTQGTFTGNNSIQYTYEYRLPRKGHHIEAFSKIDVQNTEHPKSMSGEFHYLRTNKWGKLEFKRAE